MKTVFIFQCIRNSVITSFRSKLVISVICLIIATSIAGVGGRKSIHSDYLQAHGTQSLGHNQKDHQQHYRIHSQPKDSEQLNDGFFMDPRNNAEPGTSFIDGASTNFYPQQHPNNRRQVNEHLTQTITEEKLPSHENMAPHENSEGRKPIDEHEEKDEAPENLSPFEQALESLTTPDKLIPIINNLTLIALVILHIPAFVPTVLIPLAFFCVGALLIPIVRVNYFINHKDDGEDGRRSLGFIVA